VGGSGNALDGNAPENRQTFSNAVLTGTTVLPNQEIFLRWRDVDNASGDAGLAIDDLTVSYETNAYAPPAISTNSGLTLMTYNVKGNGVADWSTNAAQVQAIGREIVYLNPDIITFNEYLPQLKQATQEAANAMTTIGPIDEGQEMQAQDKLVATISEALVKKVREIEQVRFNRQQMIDTRAEYLRSSKLCEGQP